MGDRPPQPMLKRSLLQTEQISSSKAFRLALAVIITVTFVFFVQTIEKAYRSEGNDLSAYLLAAEALWAGGNPYQLEMVFPYIYPLTLATILIPLTAVPYWFAITIWFVIGVVSLSAFVLVVTRTGACYLNQRSVAELVPWLGVLYLLLLEPIQANFLNGQANLLSLGLLALFLFGYARGSSSLTALGLAAAVAIKLVPAVLLFFLIVERRIVMAGLVAFITVMLMLAPAVVAGAQVADLYADYVNQFLVPRLSGSAGDTPELAFSLSSTLAQMFPRLENDLWLKGICVLGLFFPVVVVHRRIRHDVPGASAAGTDAWLVCLYLALIPLLSPMSENHHLAFVLPGAVLVSLHCVVAPTSRRQCAGVAVFWFAIVLAPHADAVSTATRNTLYFLALISLYAALLMAPEQGGHDRRPPQTATGC